MLDGNGTKDQGRMQMKRVGNGFGRALQQFNKKAHQCGGEKWRRRGGCVFVLEIHGEPFPAPTDYSLGTETIGRFERNANGSLIGDLTAVKTRLSCKWGMLLGADYKRLSAYAAGCFAMVRFMSQDGTPVEMEMSVQLQDGVLRLQREDDGIWWSGVGCEFVER